MIKALAERRFEITGRQVAAIVAGLTTIALTAAGSLWVIAGWQATNDLTLEQHGAAIEGLQGEVSGLSQRLTSIESDSRNDRRILLRLETKLDNLSLPSRYGSALPR
jgi:hypothetical protein